MARSYDISKQVVWQAYQRVKANKGTAGIDSWTIEDSEQDLKGNLNKIWNRLTSGSYLPPAVPIGDAYQNALTGSQIKPPALPGDIY